MMRLASLVALFLVVSRLCAAESSEVRIDVGRQLFVDDALVETTTLKRVWHHPVKFEGNPVMKPETPWEVNAGGNDSVRPNGGGMWWDEKEGVFKLWYEGGWLHTVCYATSKDGLRWERPALDVVPGTNIVLPTNNPAYRPDSWTVVKDPHAKNPAELYKLALHRPWADAADVTDGICATSADGKKWNVLYPLPPCGDRSSMYYDPFREKWVFSLRTNWDDGRRCRSIFETDDFMVAPEWYVDPAGYAVERWLAASTNDLVTAKESDFKRCQLYNFDAVAYESVMLGLFEILQGPENGACGKAGRPKITEIKFGFSRDGRNFFRGDYTAAIPSEGWDSGKWDAGYVQPLANGCVVKGDELWFYYGAFSGEPARRNTKERKYDWTVDNGMYAHAAMGLAKLRRDGFASLEGTGELLTKPLAASGHHLFVNASAKAGAIAVELIGPDGQVLPGYAAADSRIEGFDSTKRRVVWKTKDEIDVPSSVAYRLRFRLENAALYSFWVSRSPSGESNGWLAGGGPGYAGLRDVPPPRSEIPPRLLAPDAAHTPSTRRHEGVPSLAVSPKGRMWVTWYAGPTPCEDENNYLVLTSSADGGKTWKEQWVLDPDGAGRRRAFDPELWLAPDGKLRWTWTDRVGTVRSTSDDDQLWMATLDPETGDVVEKPRRIASGVMMNKPTVLKDGTWIFPVASWWERESSGCWASTDGGRTFVKRGGVTVPRDLRGFDEHTILEKRDGTLKCYIRTFNGAGNCLWEAESADGGFTWNAPRPSKAAQLSSRTFVTKLRDGRWLMVKAGGFGRIWDKRRDLVALISEDEGATWWGGLKLDNRVECSYPDGVELPDGSLAVVSDYNRTKEREISFVRFRPEDVVDGRVKLERRIVSDCRTPEQRQMADHIRANWQKTVRFNRTDEGTKIGLPFKYTVPCMADKFQEMYYWDTYFTNVGLILSGLSEQARDNVGNVAYLIEKFGYMPNGNRTYYLSRSQPPFFTRMVSEVYDAKPDKAWLVKMYAAAVKEHTFWQTQRRTASGLNRYSGSFRDDVQRKAIVEEFIPRAGWKMPTDPQEIRRMSEIFISYAESGWDCTSRFDWNPQENDWVDLNSLLYGMERDLERLAGILGNGEEAKWRTAAEKRRALMNRVMWDEQLGMFCDHDFVKDARSQFVSAAAFYPLFVGLATPEQAKRTVALLPRIECAFGIAASQKDGIKDLQWDYPHGWACLQYVVVQGLLRYGYKDEARRIAVKYARMVERVFAETGSLWEKYDVARGKVSVSREYETPKMLGWSAGVYLAFARQLSQSSSAGEKAAKRAITGMTYNVRSGLGDEKQGWYVMPLGHLGYLPQCARVIREARPDWVAIEEIDNGMQRSGGVDQTKVLAQLTGMKGYFFPKVQYEDGVYGLALLLREEPIKIWKIELGGSGKDHTRILAAAELKDAIVCATHFSLCKENRLEAAKKLKAAFGNTKKPVFIGGDFNLEPQSEEFAALNETFMPISGTNLKTWPSHEPKATIDYVFVDRAHAPSVRVESVNSPATDLLATDHRPLVVCYLLETQKGGKVPPRDRPQ